MHALEHVECPRFPEHGTVTTRWLPQQEREMLTKVDGDVFAVKCPMCGEYEWQFDPPHRAPVRQ